MAETSENNEQPGDNAKNTKPARRKAQKKAGARTPRRAARTTAGSTTAVADFDRESLGEKTRVFSLAKQLGIPSKDLVIALNGMGVVKVAQSTLTRSEALQLLDVLAGVEADPSTESTVPADVAAEADEKIRERVRKDVQNEIHQIEEKVEADLSAAEAVESDDDEVTADEHTAVEEPLTDVTPEVIPAPAEGPAAEAYAPIFKAPQRSDRRRARRKADATSQQETPAAPAHEPEEDQEQDAPADEVNNEPVAIKGSSRLEAQRRRRNEKRAEGRKRSRIVSQAEFLARRESVERSMVVRERDRHDHPGRITQVGVLEDGLLVEHFVTSEENASMIGNIYLGRVQNVLPSMEAAFIDIGQGRNGVLYASEVDWKAAGLGGRSRRIEQALKSGDQVVVQVTKDPMGHKGARLSTQISLAGRYLVYVPGGRSAGISRKLPAPERKRLKDILGKVVPGKGGAIIRTAAEGASEEAIAADVNRLHTQWEAIQDQAEKEKSSKGARPVALYEEPSVLVKVIRDLFNEDFSELVVDGRKSWNVVHNYVTKVAPDLADRLVKYDRNENGGADAFEKHRVDEQIQKALGRKVWLPSGGTLVIDRTEAMTVIDVNTGKFTGSGGSLEETVTSNNLEAAEEIVRQMRLRDLGGMIIVDFIDMILPENQELVLRRLKEALGRDRTRHQVSEVTSLGLVQMTRKRLGTGLLETFAAECECCAGRGIIVHDDPVEQEITYETARRKRSGAKDPAEHPAAVVMHSRDDDTPASDEAPEDKRGAKKDYQALAESVLGVSDSEADSGVDTDERDEREEEQDSERRERRGARRRGRRGRGRGRSEEQTQPVAEQDDESLDDDSLGSVGEGEKSFAQAVEEFENSPRRRRRTRGNSRSDHRPRREDNPGEEDTRPRRKRAEEQAAAHEPVSVEPASVEPAPQEPVTREVKKDDAVVQVADERPAGARRGRRRAVRRGRAEARVQAREPQPQKSEQKTPEPAQKSESSNRGRGRGRRRATRRAPRS